MSFSRSAVGAGAKSADPASLDYRFWASPIRSISVLLGFWATSVLGILKPKATPLRSPAVSETVCDSV